MVGPFDGALEAVLGISPSDVKVPKNNAEAARLSVLRPQTRDTHIVARDRAAKKSKGQTSKHC